MNKKPTLQTPFNLGQFVARTMMNGLIIKDMHGSNIEFNGIDYVFLDFTELDQKSLPDDLNPKTVNQLTLSLLPILDSLVQNFTFVSGFRAGFTAYGGVLTHAIFSNLTNKKISSFRYTPDPPFNASYNAKPIYTDFCIGDLITDWKTAALDNVTVHNYPSFSEYQAGNERKQISSFNTYYLDNLYCVRRYHSLIETKDLSSLADIISDMLVSAYRTGLFCTAYGLYEKCLAMNCDLAHMNELFDFIAKDLNKFTQSHPHIVEFIKACTSFELFEFMWILSDLETGIPDYSCMNGHQKTLRDLWHPHLSLLESELHV